MGGEPGGIPVGCFGKRGSISAHTLSLSLPVPVFPSAYSIPSVGCLTPLHALHRHPCHSPHLAATLSGGRSCIPVSHVVLIPTFYTIHGIVLL